MLRHIQHLTQNYYYAATCINQGRRQPVLNIWGFENRTHGNSWHTIKHKSIAKETTYIYWSPRSKELNYKTI